MNFNINYKDVNIVGKNVSFRATRIVKEPVKVSFRTDDGERITFNATRAIRRPVRVSFRTRK
jgi:hypothetical protein